MEMSRTEFYSRNDACAYCVYRKSDNKYLGMITNCDDEYHAERIARCQYGSDVCVDLIEGMKDEQ